MDARRISKRAQRAVDEWVADAEDSFGIPVFGRQVELILDHKTQGQRMGVRFHVKWIGFATPSWARSAQVAAAKYGAAELRAYLLELASRKPNRFSYLMANQPTLAKFVREEEEEE